MRSVPDLILHEPGQDKDLHVRVSYPAAGKKLPVIVFSHGHSNSKDGYRPLTEFWASHGFLVLQPTHLDSRDLRPEPRLQALDPTRSRVEDAEFVIDSLPEIARRVPALADRIDGSRIAIAGHSQGAMTAQLIAGAQTFAAGVDGPTSWRDKRVRAAVLLAPQGLGRSLREESWNNINIPVLIVTGTEDGTPPKGSPPDWQAELFKRAPAGDKYWLRMVGAGHEMGDIYDDGEIAEADRNADMVRMVRMVTQSFLDAYLSPSGAGALSPSLGPDLTVNRAEGELMRR